jgi:hypothetical protein
LLEGFRLFLRDALPTELLDDVPGGPAALASVKAVAFLDYVPVYVEAWAVPDEPDSQGTEVMALRLTLRNDVVKFHELVDLVELFLQRHGFDLVGHGASAKAPDARSPAVPIDDFCVDDFEDDELADDEIVWAQRLQPLLTDVLGQGSGCSLVRPARAIREEAAQALARLSETGSIACHVALAQALVEKEVQIATVLLPDECTAGTSPSLAEAYPLSVALKFAAFSPEAAEILARSGLPVRLIEIKEGQDSHLVAQELETASRSISEAGQRAPGFAEPIAIKLNGGPVKHPMWSKSLPPEPGFYSNVSTACNSSYISEPEERISLSTWTTCI